MVGTFDIFKIGIGPSSSHTVGPMVAAARFLRAAGEKGVLAAIARIEARLYGSLAYTGKGHGTDKAVLLGLLGEKPAEIDPNIIPALIEHITRNKKLSLLGRREIAFDPEKDLLFDKKTPSPGHPNGIKLSAYDTDGTLLFEETYFSIGGGFVMRDDEYAVFKKQKQEELQRKKAGQIDAPETGKERYPFRSARALLDYANAESRTISEIMMDNESALRPEADVEKALDKLWAAMKSCIDRGLASDGILPGALKVRRRAKNLLETAIAKESRNMTFPHEFMDKVSAYAIAVNEENAAGGRVVTSPTNGAAGVIPAVLRYYTDHCPGADRKGIHAFLLTAAAFGSIIKHNASVSGAEVGCQGEVGSASAMAAGGLCAALGGTNEQIENAAEIALEHHLGMTCDPVGGLVQIPCIERNAMGAIKAINAASLALAGDGQHMVSFDTVVETMRQTGLDMQSKYKETSEGGLAVTVVAC